MCTVAPRWSTCLRHDLGEARCFAHATARAYYIHPKGISINVIGRAHVTRRAPTFWTLQLRQKPLHPWLVSLSRRRQQRWWPALPAPTAAMATALPVQSWMSKVPGSAVVQQILPRRPWRTVCRTLMPLLQPQVFNELAGQSPLDRGAELSCSLLPDTCSVS